MRRESCLLFVLIMASGHLFAETCDEVPPPLPVKIFRTSIVNGKVEALIPEPDASFGSSASHSLGHLLNNEAILDPIVLRVDSSRRFQKMNGFGGAMTEGCAMNLMRLPENLRENVLQGLFSKRTGAGFDYIRLPIGASDFTDPVKGNYTYDDSPNDRPDPSFRHFDMSRDEKSFALIRAAKTINPDLKVMVSPWSPPAWMKTPKSLLGGKLNKRHYRDFARYLVKVITEYQNRGIPVDSVTIQNEPGYPNDDYPSMGMDALEQVAFIRDFFAPEMKTAGLNTGIFILDHNYEMYADVNAILDDAAVKAAVRGVAYHCYEGDYTDMQKSIDRHPDVPVFLSECTSMLGSTAETAFSWWLASYALGPMNMGSLGSMAWNLCLDETGGPHNRGCYGCSGLVTTDFADPARPALHYSSEYYALAQISRFLRAGSERVEISNPANSELSATAFANPDGSVHSVLWNESEKPKLVRIERSACESFEYAMPARSALTFSWNDPAVPLTQVAIAQ